MRGRISADTLRPKSILKNTDGKGHLSTVSPTGKHMNNEDFLRFYSNAHQKLPNHKKPTPDDRTKPAHMVTDPKTHPNPDTHEIVERHPGAQEATDKAKIAASEAMKIKRKLETDSMKKYAPKKDDKGEDSSGIINFFAKLLAPESLSQGPLAEPKKQNPIINFLESFNKDLYGKQTIKAESFPDSSKESLPKEPTKTPAPKKGSPVDNASDFYKAIISLQRPKNQPDTTAPVITPNPDTMPTDTTSKDASQNIKRPDAKSAKSSWLGSDGGGKQNGSWGWWR